MLITMASLEDIEDIAHNNVDLRRETEKVDMDFDQVASGVRALIDHPERGFYLLAKHNAQVVGQVMVTSEWSDWRNRFIWWLHRIYVKKEWRRQGVFTQLFQELIWKANAI